MRYTLFGMDAREPEGCARMLREKGYSGVTIGRAEPRVVEALAENGLTYDLSAGAFSLGGGFSRLAQDCEGRQWRWFSSGCPSDVGDEIRVKILKVDTDAKRISLSIREALTDEAMETPSDALDEFNMDAPEA